METQNIQIADFIHTPVIDQVGINDRVARLNSRSIKKESKMAALKLALSMIDLTTLEGMDTPGKVRQLCTKAKTLHNGTCDLPSVAAVCVYPAMVRVAKEELTVSSINVASVASSIKGLPNRFVYGASKAAIIGLTKSIASDFVKQKIRCNAIAPGTVFTPSWEDRVRQSPDPVKAKKDFIARQPMERLGTAQEIADFAIYLASEESTFTTGNTFSVDGGMTI